MNQKLLQAFKTRLNEMPYEKIKITDLCRDCGVNRQTFYYHFRNLEDLAAQFIHTEAEALLKLDDTPFVWEDKIGALIEYLDSNREMCLSVLSSMEHRLLRNILAEDTERLIRKISDSTGISATPAVILNVSADEKEFYIKFYSLAVSGLMESYLLGDFQMPPDKLIECIKKIIRRNIVRQKY
ncbi:MAG: TetR/AcrR family transcriptional regulator C-terminal domain-containing protein [Oscillospiraceae bacterium]|nr:TetR/AcrR family transcriptional regulator C-terminal domain-containing protein [Oscillospiraceae bacterium]